MSTHDLPPPRHRRPLYSATIERMGVASARELSEEFGWPLHSVYSDMWALADAGTVTRVDSWPVVWELPGVVGSPP